MLIESVHNNIIKQTVSLKEKKNRDKLSLFTVEGYKQILEILDSQNIEYIICTQKYKDVNFSGTKKYITTEQIFKKISDTQTPQGVLAVIKKRKFNIQDVLNTKGIFIVVDNLQDPGNLGTIIRTAESFSCKGIFLSKNTADIFSGKVIRSAMGAVFNIPIVWDCDIISLIKLFKQKSVKTYALALQTDIMLSDIKFVESAAIIVGNEANGINNDILNSADSLVKIEMTGKSQSLNAAVACSIAIYEVSKQINGK